MNGEARSLGAIHVDLNRIRERDKNKYITNYYRQPLKESMYQTWSSECSILFLDPDTSLFRVYFATIDTNDLGKVFAEISLQVPLTLDYIGKNLSESIEKILLSSGFTLRAVFRRINNYQFRNFQNKEQVVWGTIVDGEELLERIQSDFDPYVDHLPNFDFLTEILKKQWVLVNRREHRITGYLLFDLQGRHALIRSWFSSNSDIPMGGMVLLGKFHRVMTSLDVNSTFGWVNQDNSIATMIYRRFGYQFDGLKDFIFVRQPCSEL